MPQDDSLRFLERRIQSVYQDIMEIESQNLNSQDMGSRVMAMIDPFEFLQSSVRHEFSNNSRIRSLSVYDYDSIMENYGHAGLLQRLKTCVKEIADALNVPCISNTTTNEPSNIPEVVIQPTINQNISPNVSPTINQTATINNISDFSYVLNSLEQLQLNPDDKKTILDLAQKFEDEKNQPTPNSDKLREHLGKICTISSPAINILLQYAQNTGLMELLVLP